MLLNLDVEITAKLFYPDHHKYTRGDIKDIVAAARNTNSDAIITTQKDWVRLKAFFSEKEFQKTELLLLNVTVKVTDEERFASRISSLLNASIVKSL